MSQAECFKSETLRQLFLVRHTYNHGLQVQETGASRVYLCLNKQKKKRGKWEQSSKILNISGDPIQCRKNMMQPQAPLEQLRRSLAESRTDSRLLVTFCESEQSHLAWICKGNNDLINTTQGQLSHLIHL